MHITIDRERFLSGLELVSKVSTKHQTLPVLQCVLLETKNKENKLILKATNLELGVEVFVDTETKEEGVVAVVTQTLLQTIQLLYDKKVTLYTKNDVLVLETKNSTSNIKTLPHEEFPVIPTLTTNAQKINGKLFALGIKTASFAVSQSSIKPELGSIYIYQKKEHTLTFVSTDSFRLVEKTTPQKSVVFENPILLPHRNALEIARILELMGGDPELQVSENQCAVRISGDIEVYVTSRLTEGSFPDYVQIIPKEYVSHVTLLRADFIHALKKTNIFANKFMQVGLKIDTTKHLVTLAADNGEVGTTKESISVTDEGEELSLSFNQRYLHEPLQSFADDSITLHFAGVGRPVIMEGVNERSFRYLVMPMNK